jgi:hypothetical protein
MIFGLFSNKIDPYNGRVNSGETDTESGNNLHYSISNEMSLIHN